MINIITIIGARPQFIKASVVSRALSLTGKINETIVHTGQHFDKNMSSIFFDQLGIPEPSHHLNIHGGSHGEMTGRMLVEIDKLIQRERPDRVLVYGDTNSTLAGALAAAKLHVPIAHVEAGLRSFNMRMPEEVNRILTDQVSDILYCPTKTALKNLDAEGFSLKKVHVLNVGDVMQDAALFFAPKAVGLAPFDLPPQFVLATLHRAENTDDVERLTSIVESLNNVHESVCPVVMPLHPRTRAILEKLHLKLSVLIVDPVGYLPMLDLLQRTVLVITDSGGVQKEAYFFGKRCVTLRDQTEWVELIENGSNVLVGADRDAIVAAARNNVGRPVNDGEQLYGGGRASSRIAEHLAAL